MWNSTKGDIDLLQVDVGDASAPVCRNIVSSDMCPHWLILAGA